MNDDELKVGQFYAPYIPLSLCKNGRVYTMQDDLPDNPFRKWILERL